MLHTKIQQNIFLPDGCRPIVIKKLPWLLQFAASKPENDPSLYSCVTKRFAYIQSSKDNGVKRYDANGTGYAVLIPDSIAYLYYR